jgi:hypothetical protein
MKLLFTNHNHNNNHNTKHALRVVGTAGKYSHQVIATQQYISSEVGAFGTFCLLVSSLYRNYSFNSTSC